MRRFGPLIAVLVAALAASDALASFPGRNGSLALSAGRRVWCSPGTGQIFRWRSYRVTSSGRSPKTLSPVQDDLSTEPTWSPRGGALATLREFYDSSLGSEVRGIAVDDPTGHFLNWAVTPRLSDLDGPAFSPDGTRLVLVSFTRDPGDKYGQRQIPWITVVDAAGGGSLRRLVQGRAPNWGRGGRIVYTTRKGLMTISPTGAGRRRLTRAGADDQPDWSPSGKTIAFVRGGAIWTIAVKAGKARRVTIPPKGEEDAAPVWSPDGKRIAFVRQRPLKTLCASHAGKLVTVAPAGGAVRVLLTPGRVHAGELTDPSWSVAR